MDRFITNSQAYELSRLDHERQHILYEKIKTGKADTYQKLRAAANALLFPPPEQDSFGPGPDEKETAIGRKYDRMVENLYRFVQNSFSKEDLIILKRVAQSSLEINIEKINRIIQDLKKIQTAMIQSDAAHAVNFVEIF